MPHFFRFFIDQHLHFQIQLSSMQCTARKPGGARCRCRVVFGGPYCWVHEQSQRHLRIRPSLLPGAGNGLFCSDPTVPEGTSTFVRDQIITDYHGQIIDLRQMLDRYGQHTAPYGVQISADRFEDGAGLRGIGCLANWRPQAQGGNNARLMVSNRHIMLVATRVIRNGQEIYVSYGLGGYKIDEQGVHYQTT